MSTIVETPATPTPAPAASAPVPTPTPAAPAAAPELRSVQDVLASLAMPSTAVPADGTESLESPAPTDAAPAAAPGTASPEGRDNPADPSPTPDESAPPPEVVAADGTRFRVKGADGKYTNLPETLGHIEFTLAGEDGTAKTYVKSPAELVRMAQQSVAANRHAERVRGEAERLQQEAERAATLNAQFIDLMREVFTDESGASWQQRREEFLRMTGPEARAARAETQLHRVQQERIEAAEQARAYQWYQARIEPVVRQAFEGASNVPMEAKIGKLNLLTQHLTVNGVVPPEHREAFAEIVSGEFLAWTQQEEQRMAGLVGAAQQRQQETEAARRQAQATVNATARALAPVGRAAPDVPARAKPRNVNEALDFVARRGAFA